MSVGVLQSATSSGTHGDCTGPSWKQGTSS